MVLPSSPRNRDLLEQKSKSPLFPGAGWAVVTNDQCIKVSSKRLEKPGINPASYYNLSNVCLFVCLFVCSPTPPRSLGRSSPNLEGRWRAAPDISLRGSVFERARSSRSKVKFMFFLFVPLLLPGPWADLHQTWWEG